MEGEAHMARDDRATLKNYGIDQKASPIANQGEVWAYSVTCAGRPGWCFVGTDHSVMLPLFASGKSEDLSSAWDCYWAWRASKELRCHELAIVRSTGEYLMRLGVSDAPRRYSAIAVLACGLAAILFAGFFAWFHEPKLMGLANSWYETATPWLVVGCCMVGFGAWLDRIRHRDAAEARQQSHALVAAWIRANSRPAGATSGTAPTSDN